MVCSNDLPVSTGDVNPLIEWGQTRDELVVRFLARGLRDPKLDVQADSISLRAVCDTPLKSINVWIPLQHRVDPQTVRTDEPGNCYRFFVKKAVATDEDEKSAPSEETVAEKSNDATTISKSEKPPVWTALVPGTAKTPWVRSYFDYCYDEDESAAGNSGYDFGGAGGFDESMFSGGMPNFGGDDSAFNNDNAHPMDDGYDPMAEIDDSDNDDNDSDDGDDDDDSDDAKESGDSCAIESMKKKKKVDAGADNETAAAEL